MADHAAPSSEQPDRQRRRRTWALRAGLVGVALAAVIAVVLLVEVAGGDRAPGAELRVAPTPLLVTPIPGYRLTLSPQLAAALRDGYRQQGSPIHDVEAGEISLRGTSVSVVGARLDSEQTGRSKEFRAGVLVGAAGANKIDPESHPFRYSIRSGTAVYVIDGPVGRLYVWFFRDAFMQMFIPLVLEADADSLQQAVLGAQTR